jgi:hypothetical protein
LVNYNYNEQLFEYAIGREWGTHGKKSNACKFLVENSEGKRSLGRSGRRWNDDIKMDYKAWN